MASRHHPNDPPVQGPAPGWGAFRREPDPFADGRPWSAEAAPEFVAPVPGARLRSVRLEVLGGIVGGTASTAVLALAVLIDPPSSYGDTLSGGLIYLAAFLVGTLLVRGKHLARYRAPRPWPAGRSAEPARRTVVSAALMAFVIVVGTAAFMFLLGVDRRAAVTFAQVGLAVTLQQMIAAYDLWRLEQRLDVQMYRQVLPPFRWRRATAHYALTTGGAPESPAPRGSQLSR